jgi:hypothetical protein
MARGLRTCRRRMVLRGGWPPGQVSTCPLCVTEATRQAEVAEPHYLVFQCGTFGQWRRDVCVWGRDAISWVRRWPARRRCYTVQRERRCIWTCGRKGTACGRVVERGFCTMWEGPRYVSALGSVSCCLRRWACGAGAGGTLVCVQGGLG